MHSILMRPVYEWGQWYTAETAESLLLLLPGMGCSAGDQGHEDTQESAVKAYREGLSPVFVIVIQGHLLVAHSAATNTTPFWEWFKILSFQWPRSPDSMSPGLGMRDLCESLKKNNDKYLYSQGSQRCTLKTRRLVHSSNSTLLSSLWSLFLTLCSTHLLCPMSPSPPSSGQSTQFGLGRIFSSLLSDQVLQGKSAHPDSRNPTHISSSRSFPSGHLDRYKNVT